MSNSVDPQINNNNPQLMPTSKNKSSRKSHPEDVVSVENKREKKRSSYC